MRQLKRGIVLYLVILATVLPWSTAQALETFEKAGHIVDLRSDQFTISGQVYRLRSSTEIVSADPSRSKVSDLRSNDRVYIQGIVLNGVYYIDRLVYEIPGPS
ncbi:MAG: hypothetical protein GY875_26105 [Gammaproteobacteria bacterium]|nr:hypothetical protein [Gammaproteobacteria bacterium]